MGSYNKIGKWEFLGGEQGILRRSKVKTDVRRGKGMVSGGEEIRVRERVLVGREGRMRKN